MERPGYAKEADGRAGGSREQAFVDFVFSQYVQQGVDELDQEKLAPLLRLKHRALPDAFAELGKPEQVRKVFVGFQRHLYAA